ncbi:MAG: hypothetical protein HY963_04015 [Ignavibacteriales bacterium]|nr:hypothetical protein [Ignavibacteriales bacterium]
MKKLVKLFYVLLLLGVESFAQYQPGAGQIALAHSDVSSANDVFSLFNNPAGLALLKSREIGFYYSPAPFGVKELANAFAAYCEPTQYGSFSAGYSNYGFELFKENKFAIGYGRKIANNFFIGLSSIYHSIAIKNYGSKGAIVFNIGAIAKLNDRIGLGFAVNNVTRSTITNESNDIPIVIWFGTDLKFVKDIVISAAVKKEIGFNPSIRLGTEYSMLDFLKLRIGTSNEPNTYSGGIGIIYQIVQVDYAFFSHPDLGLTHQFGLIIRFTNN